MTEILYAGRDDSLLSIEKWENDYNLVAGMTTRHGGFSQHPYTSLNVGFHVGDHSEHVLINRETVAEKLSFPLTDWVVGKQPHGHKIFKVHREDASKGALSEETAIDGVDGLYTAERGILLVSLYADCVPLYFFEDRNQIVGIAHAGWKGTIANIAGNMVETWRKEGIDAENIQVVIGPSIGQCCYEVNDTVMDEVTKLKLEEDVSRKSANGKYMLNLKILNKWLLMRAGISEQAISISQRCTSCSNSTLFSHRKEKGKTGRMMAYIGLKH